MKFTTKARQAYITLLLSASLITLMAMKLTSTSFNDGGKLPPEYTCDGNNVSPQIAWQDAPAGTKSFVLVYDDPDAPNGTWDHWVLYNLPATVTSIPENVKNLPSGTQVGLNSWQKLGYGAPCPPSGEHRYIVHLYALDRTLDLQDNATSKQIYTAMEGYVLEATTITGMYSRK